MKFLRIKKLARNLIVISLVLSTQATPISANIYRTVKMAMQEIFPMATKFDRKTAFFSYKQRVSAGKIAGNRYLPKYLVYYIVKNKSEFIGYFFIDSHKVRTKKESIAIGLYPDFSVRGIKILSFYEPKEYFPAPTWLAQFQSKKVTRKSLKLDYDIQGMTGATLTTHAIVRVLRNRISLLQVYLGKMK